MEEDQIRGQQPDPEGTETAPVSVDPTPGRPIEDTQGSTGSSPSSSESIGREEESPSGDSDEEGEAGLLTGTASEQAPGVGGLGDHPAPAAMRDPQSGALRVAGQPADGAVGETPSDDPVDEQSGDVADPEARERLNAVVDHEPFETDRPDIGTE